MSRQTSAWMPFYIGDYLGDTQRLTTEQHGAYLLLILDYWRNGPAPDDDAVLQQIAKLDRSAWRKHRPALSRLFQVADGEWHHKRIDKELKAAAENAERRSDKASKAAQARWENSPSDAQRNARRNAKSNAPSMPRAVLGECPPQSPSPEEEVSDADASGSGAAVEEHETRTDDPLKVMFDGGIRLLGRQGKSESAARRLLGKWRQLYGPEAVIVALGAAQREGAMDIVSFVEGALRHAQRSAPRGDGERDMGETERAARELAEELGIGGGDPALAARPARSINGHGRTDLLPGPGRAIGYEPGGPQSVAPRRHG